MLFASFDNPCEGSGDLAAVFAAVCAALVLWPCLAALWPRLAPRLRAALARLDAVEVRLPSVSLDPLRRLVSRVRAWWDPEAEYRRGLARYLASLPPRSGLTVYEEVLAESESLPSLEARRVRLMAWRYLRPSANAVAAARRNAGLPAVEPSTVRALERGEWPGRVRRAESAF